LHNTGASGGTGIARGARLALAGTFLIFALAASAAGSIAGAGPVPEKGSSWFVDTSRLAQSAHGRLLCEDCHGPMKDHRKHPLKERDLLLREAIRTYDYGLCKSCHRLSYERSLKGAHAKALREEGAAVGEKTAPKSEKKRAPVCGDCHSAHYERSGLSRLDLGRRMTEVCGSCHPAQKESYLKDFHGRAAVDLGNTDSAFCTDCHNAHMALSLKEKGQAIRVCSRCHPKASIRFTSFVIHASVQNLPEKDQGKRDAVLLIHRVKIIALIVVALILAFFFGHAFVWMLRELHEKLRRH
jgi:hypothetical protein